MKRTMLSIIFFTVLLLIFYQLIERTRHFNKYKEFYQTPGPRSYPIIGSAHLLMSKSILDVLEDQTRKYGSPMLVDLPNRTYITSDPDEIKIILNDALEKSEFYRTFQTLFNNTLLIAPVQEWKEHRKLISRSFHQKILNSFVECFYSKSCDLIDLLNSKKHNDLVEIFKEFTLEIFLEATIGIKSSVLESQSIFFIQSLNRLQTLMYERIGNIFTMFDYIFSKLESGKESVKLVEVTCKFIQKVINQKRSVCWPEITMLTTKGLPVLDLLLDVQKKENLTDEYILREIMLFAAAASDTTANSLCFTFLMLGMHQEVQEKVYDEIVSVVGNNEEISYHHLSKLKYTEMAINETMRIYPVIPLVARNVQEDLNIGNKMIPSNTQVVVNYLGLHRDKNMYPNPLVYDPNRFLPEEVEKRHPYSFLPFSGGPRNCIGWKYAQMLMKTAVANVVRSFHITTRHKLPGEIQLKSTMIMTSKNPLDINFASRHN